MPAELIRTAFEPRDGYCKDALIRGAHSDDMRSASSLGDNLFIAVMTITMVAEVTWGD